MKITKLFFPRNLKDDLYDVWNETKFCWYFFLTEFQYLCVLKVGPFFVSANKGLIYFILPWQAIKSAKNFKVSTKKSFALCHAFAETIASVPCFFARPLLKTFSQDHFSSFLRGSIFFPFFLRSGCVPCSSFPFCSHRLLSFQPTSSAHYSQTHTHEAYRFGFGSCMGNITKKKFEVRLRKNETCVQRFFLFLFFSRDEAPTREKHNWNGRTLQ